jgi:hypothetical protein
MKLYFQGRRKYAVSERARRLTFTFFVLTSVPLFVNAAATEAGSCAAFASNGTSAAATYDGKSLSIEIIDPAGKPSHLSSATLRPLNPYYVPDRESPPDNCHIFFNAMGDSVALGISPGLVVGGFLEIAVADVRTSALLGHFLVKPQISLDAPALWGFLQDTKSLVITMQVSDSADNEKGLLYGGFLFTTGGQSLSSAPTTTWRIAGRTAWNRFYADAVHGRLWVPCDVYAARLSGQPFCAISSRSLTTEDSGNNIVFNPGDRGLRQQETWMKPGAAVFPNSNTIVMAETVARIDTIWRVDMREQAVRRFVVPHRAGFPNSDWSEAGSLSPDGQIAAMSFDQNTGNFPYVTEGAHWSGKHIAIVRVQPLGIVTIFPAGSAQRIAAFAVDHRNGKVILAIFRDDRWQRYELGDQTRPN